MYSSTGVSLVLYIVPNRIMHPSLDTPNRFLETNPAGGRLSNDVVCLSITCTLVRFSGVQ